MIELKNVFKTYTAGQFAVHDVSLQVRRGELMVLLGASGCGKTTTLKMINRLIEKSAGTIHVNGCNIDEADVVELRRHVGYVFQMIGLFPHMTIAENVGTIPRLLGWSKERIAGRVAELLELVGLSPRTFAGRFPRELSGGQKQRVGFARALAAAPKVMLLDEPFGALDPITRDSLQEEFKRIQTQLGLTAVMVTHDITEALLMADRIAVMQHGRIVRLGTPAELITDPGDGYVAQLMDMPRRQAKRLGDMAQLLVEVKHDAVSAS